MTLDMYRSLRAAWPRLPAAVRHPLATTRTCGRPPGPFFCSPRTSTRPGSRIESGMRRLVFLFVFGQPALRLYGRNNLISEIFRTFLRQQFSRGVRPVDHQPIDGDQPPPRIQPLDFTGQDVRFDAIVDALTRPPKLHPPAQFQYSTTYTQ